MLCDFSDYNHNGADNDYRTNHNAANNYDHARWGNNNSWTDDNSIDYNARCMA